MAFRLEKTFVIGADAATVWAFLTDPRRVARCMPGAAISEQIDERTYAGTMAVKVGPVQATYRGQLRFEQLDRAARTAVIRASGQDVRGKGGANLNLTLGVSERGSRETEVRAAAEIQVTGMLAQFGRGMIEDVAEQLFQKFAAAVRSELESPPAAAGASAEAPTASPATASTIPASPPPMDAGAMGAAAAGRALQRTARRPGFWLGVGVVALIVWWVCAS
jgi:carbon monoxide dehydrogenase subunit G